MKHLYLLDIVSDNLNELKETIETGYSDVKATVIEADAADDDDAGDASEGEAADVEGARGGHRAAVQAVGRRHAARRARAARHLHDERAVAALREEVVVVLVARAARQLRRRDRRRAARVADGQLQVPDAQVEVAAGGAARVQRRRRLAAAQEGCGQEHGEAAGGGGGSGHGVRVCVYARKRAKGLCLSTRVRQGSGRLVEAGRRGALSWGGKTEGVPSKSSTLGALTPVIVSSVLRAPPYLTQESHHTTVRDHVSGVSAGPAAGEGANSGHGTPAPRSGPG